MQKSFKQRMDALEALEAANDAARLVPELLAVADMDDDDVLAAVFDGLRQRTIIGWVGWRMNGVTPYWKAIAERGNAISEAAGHIVLPLTRAEGMLVLAALEDGQMQLGAWPSPSGCYQFNPPAPAPCFWEQPHFVAGAFVSQALSRLMGAYRDVASPPPLPQNQAEMIIWLRGLLANNEGEPGECLI